MMPRSDRPPQAKLRCKHHRRYQGRFSRLASVGRSMTTPAAARLLLVIAVPLVIMPMPAQAQGNAQSATYRVTFEGKWTTSVTTGGLPSGAHFSPLIGAVHNDSVTFWSSGGTASAGVEAVAELGATATFKSEINASSNALAVIEKSLPSGGTPTATVDFTVTTAHPLVTLLSMIAPSPDWFVGVSGLSLRNAADDGWQPSLTVDLFPYDAGTEDGTEFSLNNAATSPQRTITSIKGTGKFSNQPIATLTFDLLAAPVITTTLPIFVPENETAVATLTASDDDTPIDQLTWTIPSGPDGGPDADHFTLSEAGMLAFSASKDYENPDDTDTDRTYEVTVQVSDGDNTNTADILVTMQNVLELLTELMGPSSSDYAENGANRVATYSASSPEDNGDVTWLLSGTDSDDFSMDGGVLRFRALPDFESPSDAATNNTYSATVSASDGSTTVTKDVTVTVTNVDEPGTLTLSPTRPRTGTALTAAVTDPDVITGTTTWTWERSAGRNEWNVIGGAASSSYTPVAADAGHYLRATATYTDQHGTGGTARAVAPHVVLAHRLSRLQISGHEPSRPMYPAFDPDTLHYGVGCEDVALSLTMSTEEASTRLAVNGIQRTSQNSVVTLSGLNGQDEESDIRITLSDSAGASTTYVVHCVSSDAPVITTTARAGATEDLILFSSNDRTVVASYLLIIDNNGVPRFRRSIPEGVSHFRTHQDGKLPYSYATPWGAVPNFRGGTENSTQFVMLDNDFESIKTVRNVAPVTHATGHDFLIKEDGGYALLSYNPVQRDLSAFNDDQGDPYSTTEGTEDSIIQEVGANGQESFRWNSWDHMAIEDCTQHRFPWDYAHINTIEDADGDYVASLRGCSQVVRIDGETGEVIWRLGRSNRSDADWIAGAGTPPVPIPGDPYGEFCGQHSATLLKNGNLIIFDNGGHCVVDPATGESQREGGAFSRVVEYSLDRDSGTGQLVGAIFQRHHSLHSEFNRYGRSQGHVEPMPNGHWLISWGQGTFDDDPNTPLPPDEAITQVNPLTGEEVLSVIVKPPDEDFIFPVRAYLLSPVALADTLGPLTAEIVESPARPVFHLGPTDAPKVVVAFNQPVVDFTAATPSLSVQGATVTSISAHNVPGEPANAYLFTLTPAGVGPITFALVADQSCASSGICTADGTPLSEVPASYAIPARHTGPVLSITSSATHPTKDGFTVTITFSEPVTGLTANEIEVTNGTGSNFSGSGAVYTLEIAPNAGIEDEVTVTVTAGAVVDALNNGNRAASAAFSVDTTPPTVSRVEISSDPGSDRTYVAEDEIRVTVTFSETVEVTGTPQLRLELGGGRRTADYGGGSGTAALVFAYEVADGESDTDGVGIEANSLSGGTIRDEVRNNAELDHDGLAADSGHKVDGVKPELAATGGAVVDGTTLTLTFDETLDGSSRPETGDFTVAGGDRARTVTGVRVNGSAVELTLDVGAEQGETGIRVSYTPWNNPIQDVPGNDAEALSREPVTNDTPDTTSPTVSSLAITSNPGSDQTYASGDEIEVTVTFSETVEVEGTPQLRLRVGTRTRTAGYLRGTGTAALVFNYEVADGEEDTGGVSIEAGRIAPNRGTIEDEAENAAELDHEALAAQAGHKVDGVRPSLLSAAVDGSSLALTYGEALDGGSRPASGDFTVEVDGSGRSVTGVSISGSVVTLTLNPAVEHGDTGIRVSYSPGTDPIQDAVGNEARGLSSQSVTNTTGAQNTAPEITSPSSFDVRENQLVVRRMAARDTDAGDEVTGWEIVGGVDQSQFSIASDTGEMSFRDPPDFEAPGDNEYEVRVEVRSGAGARELEAEKTFTVSVTDEREPPGIPESPAFSGETAESLTVNWSEPDNMGPDITDYDVQYREKGTGRFIDGDQQGPGRTLTLEDLEPGTVYEVQVRAANDEGTSGWSESGEGMTVAPLTVVMASGTEPPVSGPFRVRFSFSEPVTGFSASDIETGQDPACVDDQNNTVFCDPGIGGLQTADNRVFTTTVTPWTDRVAHSYTLRLTVAGGAVRSSVGSKPNEEPEEPLEVRVAPPGVTEPISSIGLRASSGSGSMRLSWNRPSEDGGSAIIRYEYRYQAVGETWSEWENVGAGSRGVTVENLINGREYVFEVRAVNGLGKGGAETVQATPERRIAPPPPPPRGGGGGGGGGGGLLFPPEAPAVLMATAGDGTVRLEWSPPESDGGTPILRYEYRLKEGRGEFGEWTPIEDSAPGEVNATGYAVGELGKGTVYVFEVRAVNLVGNGPESEAVEVVMGLDRAYGSNFGAGDLQGGEVSLEEGPLGGSPQSLRLRFGADLRFEENELDGDGEVTETRSGSYGYRYTSRTTGELRLDYDGGKSCEPRLTFSGVGAGSYSYRCGGVLGGQGSFELTGLNRGPEITSAGAYEVAENRTRVGRVEAVDPDEGDGIGGYGIAGGADGALFAVEAGELMFREAPDYEDSGRCGERGTGKRSSRQRIHCSGRGEER